MRCGTALAKATNASAQVTYHTAVHYGMFGTLAYIQIHLQVQQLLSNGKVECSEVTQDDSGFLGTFYMTSILTFVCPLSLSNHLFYNISLCSLTNIMLAYFSQLFLIFYPCMAIPSPFNIYKDLKKKQGNKHTDDRNFIMTSSFTWVTMV